jgi:hypothetical protein
MENLHSLTLAWSHDRGILTNGKINTQVLKLTSEIGEVAKAIYEDDREELKDGIGDCMVLLTNISSMAGHNLLDLLSVVEVDPGYDAAEHMLLVMISLGDLGDSVAKDAPMGMNIAKLASFLVSLANCSGMDIEECWEHAYNQIKDRVGFLNAQGNFIKSTDPLYAQLKMEFDNATL